MQERIDYKLASTEAYKAMINLERDIDKSDLEESMIELVKSRAS